MGEQEPHPSPLTVERLIEFVTSMQCNRQRPVHVEVEEDGRTRAFYLAGAYFDAQGLHLWVKEDEQ